MLVLSLLVRLHLSWLEWVTKWQQGEVLQKVVAPHYFKHFFKIYRHAATSAGLPIIPGTETAINSSEVLHNWFLVEL
jgi:hypothetical protein